MNNNNELNFTSDVNEDAIQFKDIFNLEDLQRIQDLFSDATGVASLITDPKGNPITKPSNFCQLCKIIRSTETGLANCKKSDALNCTTISSGKQIQPCLSVGLWDTGAKISVNGIHIANWLIGQMRNEEINLQKIIDYGDEIGANREEFIEALNNVPVMSKEKLQKILEMLSVVANDYAEKIFKNIQLEKQIADQKITNDLLFKSEESLSVTLQSIGDGVISTDKNGLVVNMNPIAENLCGWKLADACKRPLSDIFNIVNSGTRIPVKNPVNKVLEKGKIIGLANHTVLISKNGTEYNIADSAGPIKDIDGAITGVVLVFSDVTEKYKAEEKLRESERNKSVLLSNLPGIAYRCKYDRQWTMEFVSDGFLSLTGYKTEDIIHNHSISFNDLILPEYNDYLWKQWEKAVQNHERCQVEYRILTADKQVKWVWEQGIPIYNSSGEVEALEGLIIDITDRKNIETALQNERLMLRTLIDNIPDPIYAKNLSGRKTLANKAEVRLLGSTSEVDVLGWDDYQFYPKEFADNFLADDQLVIKTGIPDIDREGFIIDGKGKKHWLLSSKLPLRNKDGQIIGIMGIGRDITARKQVEEDLKKSESFLRETQVIAQLGTFALDIRSDKWTSSAVLDSVFGIESDFDKSFQGWVSIIHPEWQKTMHKYVLKTVIGERRKFDKKYKIIRQNDKEERWVHGLGELVFDDAHRPVFLIGTIQDITDRVQDEEALRESEEKFRNIFENLQDVFYQVELEGVFIEVSTSIKHFADYDRDEIIGSSIDILYARTGDRQIAINNLFRNGYVRDYEIDLKTKSGDIRYASLSAKLIYDTNGKPDHIDGFIRDITERKLAENAMRESEKKFRDYIEFAPHGVFVANESGKCIEVNSAASIITGYSKEELISMNQTDLVSLDSVESLINHFRTVVKTGFASDEFTLVCKDNSRRYIAVDTVKLSEHLYLGFVVDITYRKKAEVALKSSQVELKEFASHLQNVREEEKLELAREIHDELGQILIAIKIDLGMMKQKVLKSIKPIDAENILTNFDNLFGLVDNTLNTTRRIMTDLRPEVLFLIGFVEAVKLYVKSFKERYQVTCFFETTVIELKLNSQQSVALYRIVQESLTNIAKHSKATLVNIKLGSKDDKLVMEITDNGIGFKTLQKNRPNSYGLLGMKERVYLLEGALFISSQPGEGTSIKVEIPYLSQKEIKD